MLPHKVDPYFNYSEVHLPHAERETHLESTRFPDKPSKKHRLPSFSTETEGKADLGCFTGIDIYRGLETPAGAGGLYSLALRVLNN